MGFNDGEILSQNVPDKYKDALCNVTNFINSRLLYFCDINSVGSMTSVRIKNAQSIADKKKRKKVEEMNDIVGMRIVFCDKDDVQDLSKLDNDIHSWNKETFIKKFNESALKYNNGYIKTIYDFIDFLVQEIKCMEDYNVIIGDKDYIANPKESGYQSFHIIIVYKGIPVEIQLRNLVQHFFDEFEHDVRYKADEYTRKEYNEVCNNCAGVLSNMTNRYFYSLNTNVKKLQLPLI